jgi:Ni,Fe-hydrogenase III large subunit
MVKNLKTDRINGVADVELQKDELKNIVQSVNYMTDKVKKELLENLPSSEEGRKRLDNYAALKEDLRKILEDLH